MSLPLRETDLDILTGIMRSQQSVVHAKRLVDDAKAKLKAAEAELGAAFDKVIPHVQARRDDLSLPSFDFGPADPNADPDKA